MSSITVNSGEISSSTAVTVTSGTEESSITVLHNVLDSAQPVEVVAQFNLGEAGPQGDPGIINWQQTDW